jgi:AmmeMemoRadiSam system protein B
MFDDFNEKLDASLGDNKLPQISPKAIIVPHAGYIYSGFTANIAYRIAKENNREFKRVVVIGPSHKEAFNGISVVEYDSYETPCSEIEIDKEFSSSIRQQFDVIFHKPAHKEHSTEVQMPFVNHYFANKKVVEIVYGRADSIKLSSLIEYLLEDSDNLVVISTDLSHFHTENEAGKLDAHCINAIMQLDVSLLEGCEACGMIGIEAMIEAANSKKLKTQVLNYQTSATTNGDKMSVVGYLSVAIF